MLIRLTPDAASDVERLHANAPITTMHVQHKVESLHPLFPYLARPSLNPNLKRIYLLRFAPDAPLEALKAAYEQSPFVEAVEYNYSAQRWRTLFFQMTRNILSNGVCPS